VKKTKHTKPRINRVLRTKI